MAKSIGRAIYATRRVSLTYLHKWINEYLHGSIIYIVFYVIHCLPSPVYYERDLIM